MKTYEFPEYIKAVFEEYGFDDVIDCLQDRRLINFLDDNPLPTGDRYIFYYEDGISIDFEAKDNDTENDGDLQFIPPTLN